jgi:hypothetical protein
VLSTLFWFLTVGAWVRWIVAPSPGRYAAIVVAFALGLMAKPMLVTLPLTLLLLDVWPLARWSRGDAVRLVVEKLPLFALAAASAVITLVVQRPAMQVLEACPSLHARATRSCRSSPTPGRWCGRPGSPPSTPIRAAASRSGSQWVPCC